MKKKKKSLRLRWRNSRPPNYIEDLVVALIQDIAEGQPIKVIPQTKIVESRDKFSACAVVRVQDDTQHQRSELNIAVRLDPDVADLAVAPFNPQHPSLLRFIIPADYASERHRNEIFEFLNNKLMEYVKGVWREIRTFQFFKEVQTYADADGARATVQSIRYANREEDQEGYDLVLTLYTTGGDSKSVKLQVTGGYVEEDKDYGHIGIIRYAPNRSEPRSQQIASFLLGLYRGEEGQEIYFPQ